MDNPNDLLDEYFDRETSPERKILLKQQILANPGDLEGEILFELEEAIKSEKSISELKSRISQLKEPQKRSFFSLKIAASVAIIAVASFLIFSLQENRFISGNELFISYYQPYDGVVIVRGESSEFEKGMNAYNAGKYEEALSIFLAGGEKETAPDQLRLLIASCYLSLGESDRSIEVLSQTSDESNSLIADNISWYLALAYLQKGRLSQSGTLLETLISNNSPFQKKASDLLREPLFETIR